MYIFKSMSKSSCVIRILSILFLISGLLIPVVSFGGSLEAPTGPTTQGSRYTLGHIYNLLKTGAEGTAVTGTFSSPGSIATTLTTTPSNNTLNDIYEWAPKPATTANTGATRNEVCSSKSYFSLLTASTTPAGTWGSLTGLKDCTAAPTATDVNINLGNEPTTQQNISITTIRGGCTDTDTTLTNSSITVSAATSVRGATLSRTDANTLAYTPNPSTLFKYLHAGETTKDSFAYTCTDGVSGHDRTATVYITVNGADDNPVAIDSSLTTNEDTTVGRAFSVTDVDTDIASLTYSISSGPTNGTVTLISSANAFTYTPNANYNGSDSFNFRPCGGCTAETVSITVTDINDAPTFDLISPRDQRAAVGTAGAINVNNFATNISKGPADESGQSFTGFGFSVSKTDPSSVLVGTPTINSGTGRLTYSVHATNTGTAQLSVTLSDDGGGNNTSPAQIFSITVY